MIISEYQFGGTLIMLLLTVAVVFSPNEEKGTAYYRAKWMMTGSLLLLTVLFFLQYLLEYRSHGEIAKNTLLNLLFLMPSAFLANMSMLYLLRNGRIRIWEWIIGPAVYAISVMILIISILLSNNLQSVKYAEYVVSVIYVICFITYILQQLREYKIVKEKLEYYFGHPVKKIISWFQIATVTMIIFILVSPITFFVDYPIVILVTVLLMIFSVFFYVLNFIYLGIGETHSRIEQNKQKIDELAIELPKTLTKNEENNDDRVEQAIRKWLDERGHLKPGLTIQNAVEEMHLPRYLLVRWIKNTKYEVFSRWITHLRIEEAKHLLTVHPEYSNDAVAHECGFSTRSYFQKVFREQTGMTPLEYQNKSLKG